MSAFTENDVLTALAKVRDLQSGKNIVEAKIVKNLSVVDNNISLTLEFKKDASQISRDAVEKGAKAALANLEGIGDIDIQDKTYDPLHVIQNAPPPPAANGPRTMPQPKPQQPQANLPNARHTIAVASGKGGVGKTTVSVNLAVCLAQTGAKVGLLDADIYGPNVPIMMGMNERLQTRNNKIAPLNRYGVDMVSVGFISQGDAAIIWRGPLVGRMIQQFLSDVDWGDLDYLIIDMPPGTGDAQLTLTQTMALTGSIVVCTPQAVALADVKKGINMFKKVEVPILGIVENMSYFVAPDTGNRYDIFGQGGGRKMAAEMKVPFLGEIPLEPATRIGGDEGKPIVTSDPDSPVTQAFKKITNSLIERVDKRDDDQGLLKRVFRIN